MLPNRVEEVESVKTMTLGLCHRGRYALPPDVLETIASCRKSWTPKAR